MDILEEKSEKPPEDAEVNEVKGVSDRKTTITFRDPKSSGSEDDGSDVNVVASTPQANPQQQSGDFERTTGRVATVATVTSCPSPVLGNSSPPASGHTIQVPPSGSHFKPVPVSRWDLKFTDDRLEKRGVSLYDFLERLGDLCESQHVSKDEVIKYSIDLFPEKSPAEKWYKYAKPSQLGSK